MPNESEFAGRFFKPYEDDDDTPYVFPNHPPAKSGTSVALSGGTGSTCYRCGCRTIVEAGKRTVVMHGPGKEDCNCICHTGKL